MSRYTLDNLRELPNEAPVRDVAGALDLDVPGWADKVDLEKLNMERGTCCVAGQIARSWHGSGNGYMRLMARLPDSVSPRAFGADNRYRRYWADQIKKRRSA